MYLEISARRSGKTTRLIEAAEKTPNSIIIVPTNIMALLLRERTSVPVVITDRGIKDKTPFYDEFDMMESLTIRDDGYYVTTPNTNRYCSKLVKANSGEYSHYPLPETHSELLEEWKDTISSDAYRRELLGEWE
jgi:hypothetical protein